MSSIFDGMAALFVQHLGDREAFPYTHGATTVSVKGIVEMPAMTVDGLSEPQIVDANTWLHCAAADLPTGYGEGDTVVVRGVSYRVKAPMPDGRGMVRLPLFKA
jgi:hypothetical protein